ncbi:MBL fold metallo-hydrolase [Sutcliffiella horikoshii]|uniref:MBL fold metallo-hydrolase n=1 Tax=Sutcliffiella horikoshii TaxID=79883 RepID=UPI0007D07C2D|nr:MBL fold metallo-hydrolase [Sutcliffiella horikoshii]MCM3616480.1 MBL fold metallo-hydrolase [Sutcliffiella horikoshii]
MRSIQLVIIMVILSTPLNAAHSSVKHPLSTVQVIQPSRDILYDIDKPKTAEQKAPLLAHFIDVGQGDSILLQTPNGSNILIDTGPKKSAKQLLSYLKKINVTSIDLLVITHPDFDHIGGIPSLLEKIPVKKILDSGKAHTTLTFIQYKQYVWNNIVPVQYAKEKMSLQIDPDIKIKVLNSGSEEKETNNASIVLHLTYGDIKYLLMGDTEEEEEKRLSRKYNLESTILKVAHHGSNSSSTASFLKDVQPKIAVISAGRDNDFHHPHLPVINRLIESGADIYNTAESETIVFSTDGKLLYVNNRPWLYANQNKKDTSKSVVITDLDVKEEMVTIENKSDDTVDMSYWKLVSKKGYQTYDFPVDYKLQSGETIYIASGAQKQHFKRYIHWLSDYLWNNKGDKAQLYDDKGELVDEFEVVVEGS